MALYHLVDTFTNEKGDALVGYYIRLKHSEAGTYATLYADKNQTPIETVSGLTDAAKTTELGRYSIYVADGTYDVEYFDKNNSDLLLDRVMETPMYGFDSASDALAASASATASANSASAAASSASDASDFADDAEGFKNQAETAAGVASNLGNAPIYGETADFPTADGSQGWAIILTGVDEGIYEDQGTWVRVDDTQAVRAAAWAEGTEPGGVGTKSAKEHALDAANSATSLGAATALVASEAEGINLDVAFAGETDGTNADTVGSPSLVSVGGMFTVQSDYATAPGGTSHSAPAILLHEPNDPNAVLRVSLDTSGLTDAAANGIGAIAQFETVDDLATFFAYIRSTATVGFYRQTGGSSPTLIGSQATGFANNLTAYTLETRYLGGGQYGCIVELPDGSRSTEYVVGGFAQTSSKPFLPAYGVYAGTVGGKVSRVEVNTDVLTALDRIDALEADPPFFGAPTRFDTAARRREVRGTRAFDHKLDLSEAIHLDSFTAPHNTAFPGSYEPDFVSGDYPTGDYSVLGTATWAIKDDGVALATAGVGTAAGDLDAVGVVADLPAGYYHQMRGIEMRMKVYVPAGLTSVSAILRYDEGPVVGDGPGALFVQWNRSSLQMFIKPDSAAGDSAFAEATYQSETFGATDPGDREIEFVIRAYNSGKGYESRGTATMSIASPGVVTFADHMLENDTPVMFGTTGALPTGLTVGRLYYVRNATDDTFELATAPGGASFAFTGSQSGTHTLYTNPTQRGDEHDLILAEVDGKRAGKFFYAPVLTEVRQSPLRNLTGVGWAIDPLQLPSMDVRVTEFSVGPVPRAGSSKYRSLPPEPAPVVPEFTKVGLVWDAADMDPLANEDSNRVLGPSIIPMIDYAGRLGIVPIDNYYLYYSTDHTAGEGGIWLATAPAPEGPWTNYVPPGDPIGENRIYVDTVTGTQTEQPFVAYDDVENRIVMHYHNRDVLPGGGQQTLAATSPDGVTFTRQGLAQDTAVAVLTTNRLIDHSGYSSFCRDPLGIVPGYVGWWRMTGGSGAIGGTSSLYTTARGATPLMFTSDLLPLAFPSIERPLHEQNIIHFGGMGSTPFAYRGQRLLPITPVKTPSVGNGQGYLGIVRLGDDMRNMSAAEYIVPKDLPTEVSGLVFVSAVFVRGNTLYLYYINQLRYLHLLTADLSAPPAGQTRTLD